MRKKYVSLIIKTIASVALATVICNFSFHYLESLTYDLRIRLSPYANSSEAIRIVTFDVDSKLRLERDLNYIDLGLAIKAISEDSPLAIVSLIPAPNSKTPTAEKAFLAKSTLAINNLYFGWDRWAKPEDDQPRKLPPPLEHLKLEPVSFPVDKVNFAADDVARRINIFYEKEYNLYATVAQLITPVTSPLEYRGSFEFSDSVQTLTNFADSSSYKNSHFVDIIEHRFPKGFFSGKIVVLGKVTKDWLEDYVRTPLDRNPIAMSKVELFAQITDTLIKNDGITKPSNNLNLFITIIISLITVYVVSRFSPMRGIVTLLALALTYSFVAWALFALFRVSITMTHPLLAIFVSYYFFIPYRLIQESRKSWEYQQKNKLLTEVEQLKTNFLSMMSHDLKTPLARIQGMADIAIAHPENLTPEQKTALKTIGQSTDELSTFISSILDLGRVESQEVKLQLQSRDINSLLEEVIAKYEYFAKSKNIEIVREFEPLFSTKIDVALMKQVFSNLIENAIKYSQEGAKILVSTEEVDGKIQVQVADQGIGIEQSELNNVFMKFYRSQNVKNSPIKGSGLGLFLAKYFVDLHKGQISVESVPEQGSTFTVDLPMQ